MSLLNTGMRYPGGELTLTYFGKRANGYECYDLDEPDTLEGLTAYKSTTLNVDWERPEVFDVYKIQNGDTTEIHFEVSPRWLNFDNHQELGGLGIYDIKNYNRNTEKALTAVMRVC